MDRDTMKRLLKLMSRNIPLPETLQQKLNKTSNNRYEEYMDAYRKRRNKLNMT